MMAVNPATQAVILRSRGMARYYRRNPPVAKPAPAAKPRSKPAGNPLAPLLTNPLVFNADLNRQRVTSTANAQLNQLRSQALINFGDPSLVQGLGFAVDPNTAAAAAANQYSTVANLGHNRDILHHHLLGSLAGHGLTHSGELGYQEGEQNRAYGQALSGAEQTLLGQLNDYLTGYMGTTQSANDQYQQALIAALGQYGQNPLGLIG